ncbi:MBL fold metallo-hydrolase [uncultured Clostridium sp.]|uniref:MBL fold metallo-hydrolase n=1 Tax=uncultured Clostridium sp. TaxID=59620 RepID=UPI0025D28CAA|nr:MBL fold metallo-hydrolase [uncultured Clostridium sp.]
MKLKVLIDNNTYIDEYYLGEPAVSFYIEDEGKKFLFDAGYSDAFIKNAEAMNIDLKNLDKIIISHGHDDHTRGLKYYFKYNNKTINLLSHPLAFKEKRFNDLKICSPILDNELKNLCSLTFSKTPIKISSNITFLGEIPSSNNFESRKIIGKTLINSKWTDDYVIDDTALVYKNPDGIFIITGCSHSGICNIIEYAKKVCNDNRILGVIGGFHLFNIDDQLKNTIKYFKDNNITNLYPCHCTSFLVKAQIHKNIPIKEVGVGMELEL